MQDTYTLLRKGLRRLLKAAGFHLPNKRQGLSPQTRTLLERYVDHDCKADINWADPQQRAAQLQVLFEDAEAVLALVAEQSDDDEVRALAWALTKIIGDDLVVNDQGQAEIGQGTAEDRIISVTDLEMRHGRKSSAHRFNGFKSSVSTEQSSEMILDIADVKASGSDGHHLLPTIQRVEKHTDVTVDRAMGDGAYGSGKNRAACANYPGHAVDLVAPMARPADPEIDKSAFDIDLSARTATCPKGHTVTSQAGGVKQDGQDTWLFTFPRLTCEACPLFERCVRSKKTGRTVRTRAYESYLQEARLRQETEEFDLLYRLRAAIERKIAELVQRGIRDTRYVGESKRQLQRLWTAAAVNLKRLFYLADVKEVDLVMVLSCLQRQKPGCAAA